MNKNKNLGSKMIDIYKNQFKEYGHSPASLGCPKGRQDLRFKALTRNISNGRLLDFGCGFGDLSFYLEESKIDVEYYGCDVMQEFLSIAKKNRPNKNFFLTQIGEPLKEDYDTDKPLSFYAATKKSNEVMAHSYSNIYKLPCTGLRFFTVYGPMGRPDMSLYKFSNAIIKNKKIELYNKGNHYRDFTYVDDVVISISKLLTKPSKNQIPYDIFNIGSSKPYYLKKFLSLIEENLSKKAMVKFLKIQQGDVHKTHADVSKLKEKIKYSPKTDIRLGIKLFIDWYKAYYRLKK